VTSKQAEMQCSNVNPGAIRKAEPHSRARGVKHLTNYPCWIFGYSTFHFHLAVILTVVTVLLWGHFVT